MKVIMCALRGRGGRFGERDSWHLRLEIGEKDVSNTIDTVQKDYLLQEGVLVAEYKDLRTAERETPYARSSIAAACNGNKKTLNGYIWKYGNERH